MCPFYSPPSLPQDFWCFSRSPVAQPRMTRPGSWQRRPAAWFGARELLQPHRELPLTTHSGMGKVSSPFLTPCGWERSFLGLLFFARGGAESPELCVPETVRRLCGRVGRRANKEPGLSARHHQPSQSNTQPSPHRCPCSPGRAMALPFLPQRLCGPAGCTDTGRVTQSAGPRGSEAGGRGAGLRGSAGPGSRPGGGRGAARTEPLRPAGGRAAPRLASPRRFPGGEKPLCSPPRQSAAPAPGSLRGGGEGAPAFPGDAAFPRGSGAAAAARPYPQLPWGVTGVFIIIINGSSLALRLYYSPIVRGSAQGGQRQSVPGNRRSEQREAGGKKRRSGRGSVFLPWFIQQARGRKRGL